LSGKSAGAGDARRVWPWLLALAALVAVLLGVAKALHLPSRFRDWAVAEWSPKKPAPWRARRVARVGEYAAPPSESIGAGSRLVGRIPTDPDAGVRAEQVELDGERRSAVGTPVPGAFEASFTVPAAGQLFVSLAQQGAPLQSRGVRFRLSVVAGGPSTTVVLDEVVAAWDRRWAQRRVDLTRWSGERVTLAFRATSADAAPVRGLEDVPPRAFWGDLFVRARDASGARVPPSVLMVLIDTLRADHLGTYGYPLPTSPNIDALAADGARFDHAIAAAPWTDPSVLALHTGLHPSDVWETEPHAETIAKIVPGEVETLAEHLAAAGYFTIAASDHPGINQVRFGQGFDVFAALHHRETSGPYWSHAAPAAVAARVDALIDGRDDAPLFFYLHVIYPHQPVLPGEGYRALFGAGTRDVDISDEHEIEEYIRRYDAEIRVADDVVASALRSFRRRFRPLDTVVVVLSDHGEGFFEHGLYEHGNSLYDELLRVPLIFHAPGRIAPGTTIDEVVRIVDVLPTVTELAGVAAPAKIRGRSLLPLLSGEESEERLAFSESPHRREIVAARSMRSGDRKLVLEHRPGVAREWFDLSSDPGEIVSRTDADDGVERLQTALDAIAAEPPLRDLEEERVAPSAEMVEGLRALGYVE
jgi:arylsulfatase A-like enzyme